MRSTVPDGKMAASTKVLSPLIVSQTRQKASASVIFLHGSGDTNAGLMSWVGDLLEGDFCFPHIRIIYPTAPVRPYTPFGGMPSTVWFDRLSVSPDCPEHGSVDQMCDQLSALVKAEVDDGIPLNRIVLGGFSMGGAMALHLAYKRFRGVAGVFALSAFLNNMSAVYKKLETEPGPSPPLFMGHGARDMLVHQEWGQSTFKQLKSLNVQGQFHSYPSIAHDMSEDEIITLQDWISNILPDAEKS